MIFCELIKFYNDNIRYQDVVIYQSKIAQPQTNIHTFEDACMNAEGYINESQRTIFYFPSCDMSIYTTIENGGIDTLTFDSNTQMHRVAYHCAMSMHSPKYFGEKLAEEVVNYVR